MDGQKSEPRRVPGETIEVVIDLDDLRRRLGMPLFGPDDARLVSCERTGRWSSELPEDDRLSEVQLGFRVENRMVAVLHSLERPEDEALQAYIDQLNGLAPRIDYGPAEGDATRTTVDLGGGTVAADHRRIGDGVVVMIQRPGLFVCLLHPDKSLVIETPLVEISGRRTLSYLVE